MDHLWAPWRLSYVAAPKAAAQPTHAAPDCFVCRGVAGTADRENLIAHRTPLSVVVLNRFPYNTGHLLVCPLAHKATLDDLSPAEMLDQQLTLRRMCSVLGTLFAPDGYNVGLNLGAAAGAGLPGHLHWHIVPRWNGDTNFMPVLADTKVLVQSLDTLYDRLTAVLAAG